MTLGAVLVLPASWVAVVTVAVPVCCVWAAVVVSCDCAGDEAQYSRNWANLGSRYDLVTSLTSGALAAMQAWQPS